MPNSVITDALSRARPGSCCRTPPGTPMHRRCGCDLSLDDTAARLQAIDDGRGLDNDRGRRCRRRRPHRAPLTNCGSRRPAARPRRPQPSTWAPLPRSTSLHRCPTPFPPSIRADLLRGSSPPRGRRGPRGLAPPPATGTLSCRAIVVHRRLDGLVHAAVLQRPFPIEPTVIVDEPSIVEAAAEGVAVGRDVHGTTVATRRWQRSPPIGGYGR